MPKVAGVQVLLTARVQSACLSPLVSEGPDLLWGVTASHGSAKRISLEITLIKGGEPFLFSKLCFEVTATPGFEMQLQALVLAFCSMAFFQFDETAFLFNLLFFPHY